MTAPLYRRNGAFRSEVPTAMRLKLKSERRPNGCIEWTGKLRADGYGMLSVNNRHVLAHRASYEHEVGPIPDGLQLDHLCRNRACINPQHLEPVTARENGLRSPVAISGVNAAKACCPKCGRDYDIFQEIAGRRPARNCRPCRLAYMREWRLRRKAADDLARLVAAQFPPKPSK